MHATTQQDNLFLLIFFSALFFVVCYTPTYLHSQSEACRLRHHTDLQQQQQHTEITHNSQSCGEKSCYTLYFSYCQQKTITSTWNTSFIVFERVMNVDTEVVCFIHPFAALNNQNS